MNFLKVHAAGNDFILIDDRLPRFPKEEEFVKKLCQRRFGIGADGLILLSSSEKADIRMIYFNADGLEASFCGNGLRAAFFFAESLGIKLSSVESAVGVHKGCRKGEDVEISLPSPQDLNLNLATAIFDHELNLHSVNTGVPHAVCFLPKIEEIDVDKWGREIRFHPRFGEEGVNANFARLLPTGQIRVRTFERGVGETFACGSGGAAAYLIAKELFSLSGPRRVLFSSGDEVEYNLTQEGFFMKGPVRAIFKGELLCA